MMATRLDLIRGDSWVHEFTILDAAGVPVDITGCLFRFMAKADPADADNAAVITATSGNGLCVITSTSGGTMEVRLTPTQTDNLAAPAELVWDLQVRDNSGAVWTPIMGKLHVIEDISRTAP